MIACLSSGALEFFCESLQVHELLEALVNGEAEVFADQRQVDAPFIGLNDRIKVCIRSRLLAGFLHNLPDAL
ncbi:MAG TPA: hypothetical protein VFR12_01470 [Pyrinomonadaceae bacterium]|nr:hypothetical protein [Pyrinomonadaceae bacterium]